MKQSKLWLDALEVIHNAQLAVDRAQTAANDAEPGGIWEIERAGQNLSKAYREALEKYGAAILAEHLAPEVETVA